jgi:hypothetical protein
MTIKIGIDIDTIRDLNTQIVKYYKRDINPQLIAETEETIKNLDIDEKITFKTKKEKETFFYEDYFFDIYGASYPFQRNLPSNFNKWIKDMEDITKKITIQKIKKFFFKKNVNIFKRKETINFKPSLFSIMAAEPVIGATHFFLSKIASRCRDVTMPLHSEDLNKEFDVLITLNKKLIKNRKRNGSIIIPIKRDYNKNYIKKNDISYNELQDLFNDNEFFDKILKKKNFNAIKK